jgi:hypothetical protein
MPASTRVRRKIANHLAYSWSAQVDQGIKAPGQLSSEGMAHYSPPLPHFPGGTATMTVDGSLHGGLLRLEMTDRQNPFEAPWEQVDAGLVEDSSGELVVQVPARIGKSSYSPVPRWVRGYFGASTPPDPMASYAAASGVKYEPRMIEPHTVTLTLVYQESEPK